MNATSPKPSRAVSELKRLMLAAPRVTLAAAESLTCGRVQARIGEVPGASEFFLGGITAYTLDAKVKHLGIDRASARRANSVSDEIARQMARGAGAMFGSDLAVATTGYAEPSPANEVSTPFAWWALVHRRRGRIVGERSGRIECPGASRVDAQTIVTDAVVAELVAYLEELRKK